MLFLKKSPKFERFWLIAGKRTRDVIDHSWPAFRLLSVVWLTNRLASLFVRICRTTLFFFFFSSCLVVYFIVDYLFDLGLKEWNAAQIGMDSASSGSIWLGVAAWRHQQLHTRAPAFIYHPIGKVVAGMNLPGFSVSCSCGTTAGIEWII